MYREVTGHPSLSSLTLIAKNYKNVYVPCYFLFLEDSDCIEHIGIHDDRYERCFGDMSVLMAMRLGNMGYKALSDEDFK